VAQTSNGTAVLFPSGATAGVSVLLAHRPVRGPEGEALTALVVRETPFHPVDHRWPDQPGDTGTATLGGLSLPIADCVIGMRRAGSEEISLAGEIVVRRDEPGWDGLVAHLVAGDVDRILEAHLGAPVRLRVDAERRRRLSAAHTVCHLSGLALDRALTGLWRKDVPVNVLGDRAFEDLALESSAVGIAGFRDEYRIGTSLRRKGFAAAALRERATGLSLLVTAQVRAWLGTRAAVRLEADGPLLTDRRTWVCALPEGEARVPCGGTHPRSLAEIEYARVDLRLSEDGTRLTAVGVVRPAPPGPCPLPHARTEDPDHDAEHAEHADTSAVPY
jgi:alanyl-tRNA synthetase